MIKNVFFDLDGTLINTEPGILEGLRIALTEYGYEVPEYGVLKSCIGPPFLYSFPNILHLKEEDVQPAIDRYRRYYDAEDGLFNADVYPGIEDLLESLNKQGYNLMVCSSKPEPTCIKLLKNKGLDKYFTTINGATLDGKIDNKVDVIKLCFSRAPWMKKEETILIGDTKYDAAGASLAGIDCLGVSWGFGENTEMLEAGAALVVDTCQEVADYIESH